MADSDPGLDLISRLREDLSLRWQRGERVRVESYLEQYPHLASDPDAVLDLVYAEVLLRVQSGETPTLDEYLARFAGHADALRKRWAVHRLLIDSTIDRLRTSDEPATRPTGAARQELPEIPGYEMLDVLGQGGMGVVYRARQGGINRVVAVKMLLERCRDEEGAIRFRREVEAAGRLNHRHVLAVHAFDDHHGQPYFVMEYLSGGSLADLLKRGRPDPRRIAELVGQVARGVQAAHDSGIIHRDIKPGNVLLDEAGDAKVADFGLARLADASDLTRTGARMGTPSYMAPEQARQGNRADRAADLWAIGAILYECLTGRPPFKGVDAEDTLA